MKAAIVRGSTLKTDDGSRWYAILCTKPGNCFYSLNIGPIHEKAVLWNFHNLEMESREYAVGICELGDGRGVTVADKVTSSLNDMIERSKRRWIEWELTSGVLEEISTHVFYWLYSYGSTKEESSPTLSRRRRISGRSS